MTLRIAHLDPGWHQKQPDTNLPSAIAIVYHITYISYLHQEHVLVAVVHQHVVVDLGDDAVLVLPVEIPDVAGVDFVLVFDCCDEPRDGGRDKVQGGVDVLGLLPDIDHDPLAQGRNHLASLRF